jgi:phosphate transport system permease protein
MSDPYAMSGELFDPTRPLSASGHLRRRQFLSRLLETGQTVSALLAVGVLAIVVYSVASRGADALNLDFFTKGPPALAGTPGGGILPEILGTTLLMALATLIALPVGILIALFLT